VEAERLVAEEAARVEAERLVAEEAARVEAERLVAEEAARVEAERLAAEEAARVEAERLAAEEVMRVEAERVAAEEAARVEAERLAAEEVARVEAEREALEKVEQLRSARLAAEEAARVEAEKEASREVARQKVEKEVTDSHRDKEYLADEAKRLQNELVAACDALVKVRAKLYETQNEAIHLKDEKRSVIQLYRDNADKKKDLQEIVHALSDKNVEMSRRNSLSSQARSWSEEDLDFSLSNVFDKGRRSSVKADCKNVSVDNIKDKLFKRPPSSPRLLNSTPQKSMKEEELKALMEAKRVQVRFTCTIVHMLVCFAKVNSYFLFLFVGTEQGS
jgi:hypothetical protein